jgi:hypothetical protein
MLRSCLLITALLQAGLWLVCDVSSAFAAEKVDVKTALSHSIIDAGLPMAEVQTYTESRVPPMPEVATAAEWERHAERMRRDALEKVVFRGEAAHWRTTETRVEWVETIAGGPGYRVRKLRYEALPGLWIPALLYEPEQLQGKVPVVMNVNGHDRGGKAADYKQLRCINLAKRGMIALNLEWVGMGQLRDDNFLHYRMNQLDLCGTSGLAPFYLSMSRGLDLLLDHEHADPARVAVAGLSGGGWQTIFISSLDTRVTLSNPVAGYSSFRTRARHLSDLGDSEQTPVDLATVTDYAQMTAMLAPRPTLLTYNAEDQCCFKADHALPPLLDAARPIFELYGKKANLRSHVNHDPGTHNFLQDNREALYRSIGAHFYAGDSSFSSNEIPSEGEVKSSEELHVALPENNADFNKLALEQAAGLPRNADIPADQTALAAWRKQRRSALADVVKAKTYDVRAEDAGTAELTDGTATFHKLKLGTDWTVPAVELVRGTPQGTTIVVADEGRASAAEHVERLLAEGRRVIAVDPFYFGESKIAQRDFLFGLLVSAVGDRPLGLQASQLTAIARWAKSQHGQPVQLLAIGPRTSLFTLIAAGLEPEAVNAVELHNSFGSLKEIIERNMSVNQAPELFTFGLLESVDIPQLTALATTGTVRFVGASERLKEELRAVKGEAVGRVELK